MKPAAPRRPGPGRIGLPVLLALAVLSCASLAPEPVAPAGAVFGDYSYANSYLDWIVRREIRAAGIPGAAVIVVSRDGVIAEMSYGVADSSTRVPVTNRTMFRAGSLTKSLTALAIMKLSEAGRIDLDAPVNTYLPEFALRYRAPDALAVTARHLLCHQGGFPADHLRGIMGRNRLTPAELVRELGGEYAGASPGERFLYSNTGYGVLGALIERVTGRRYEDYVKAEILEPAGMTRSALEMTDGIAPDMASGHMARSLGFFPGGGAAETGPVPYLPIRDAAAGALLTDSRELGTYLRFLLRGTAYSGGRVVSGEGFREMIRPRPAPEQVFVAADYGYGFMSRTFVYPGVHDVVHHSGNVNGFYTMMAFSPSRGLGIAVLTNSTAGFFPSYRIVSRALRHYLAATAPGPAAAEILPTEAVSPEAPLDPPSCAGHYALLGLRLEVVAAGRDLRVSIPAVKLELALEPLGRDRFRPVFRLLGFIPVDVAPHLGFEQAVVRFVRRDGAPATLLLEGLAGEAWISIGFRRAAKPAVRPGVERLYGSYALVRDERDREALDLYLPMKEVRLENRDGWIVLCSPELGSGIALALEFIADDEALLLGTHETVSFKDEQLTVMGLRAVKTKSP